jgi:glycosyltransferase 2 family protein
LKNKILIIIKLCLSIGLIALILNNIDISSTIQLLINTNLKFFLLALVVLALQTLIATARWRIVLECFNFTSRYMKILGYLWIGIFFNQALPSSIGGDAIRCYYLCRGGSTVKDASLGILLDRLSGMMGLMILVLSTTPLLFNMLNSPSEKWGVVFMAVGILSAITIVFVLDFIPQKFSHWKIVRGFYALASEGRRVILSKSYGLKLILLSTAIHSLSIIAVIVLARGLGLTVEWLGILIVVPLVALFMTIPISIAGWGIREGVMVVGLGYLGVEPEQALALSILYGLLMLAIALPGGVIWLLGDHSSGLENNL